MNTRNKKGGFELGGLIFWIAIGLLIIVGFTYKTFAPLAKNNTGDGTAKVEQRLDGR